MKLTYYGYRPFDIASGKLTVLATAAPKIYRDLVMGLRGDTESVRLATDDFDLLNNQRDAHWYGDPLLEIDLNGLFQRKLQAQLLKTLSNQQVVQLTGDWQQLLTQILGTSYLMDVPMAVPETPELVKLIKLSGLRLAEDSTQTPYAILETLIKTLEELHDQRLTVLTNVSHYLQVPQLEALGKVVAEADLTVIVIEFSETRQVNYFKSCQYYYIDRDFVLW